MVSDGIQVRLHGVTRIYPAGEGQKPVHALGPLDLDLRAGRVLLRRRPLRLRQVDAARRDCRAGDAQPRARSSFEGEPVAGRVPDGVGVVFQEDASFPWLTVCRQRRLRRCAGPALPDDGVRERVEHTLSAHGADALRAGLSGAALRRHAPAGLHRPHPGHAPAPAPARRALRRARPADAAAHGRRTAAAVARDRRHRPADHACARRGDHAVRPRRRDVGAARACSSTWSRPAGRASATAASSRSRLRPHHRPPVVGAARPIASAPWTPHGDAARAGSASPSSAAPSRSSRRPAGSASSAGTR